MARHRSIDALVKIGLSSVVTGTIAGLVSTAAMALLGKAAGRRPVQPTNATSHWIHGDQAGEVARIDLEHTLVGFGTHQAASVFWAALFEIWLTREQRPPPARLLRDAAVVSAVAATVDYALVPRRISPGWEAVLSTRSIVAIYGALTLGLAAGAIVSREMRRSMGGRGTPRSSFRRHRSRR